MGGRGRPGAAVLNDRGSPVSVSGVRHQPPFPQETAGLLDCVMEFVSVAFVTHLSLR